MKEQLISLETAKLAKEKGFDIKVKFYYDGRLSNKLLEDNVFDENWNTSVVAGEKRKTETYSAPTQSLLQKWIREEHEKHIDMWYNSLTEKWRFDSIFVIDKVFNEYEYESNEHSTYEEALEEGLFEALKLIK